MVKNDLSCNPRLKTSGWQPSSVRQVVRKNTGRRRSIAVATHTAFFQCTQKCISPAVVPKVSPAPRDKQGWTFIVRFFRHRNYRLFFSGQSVSLIGTWMTRIATSWLVYRLTGSALLLGVVGFAGQIPDVPARALRRSAGSTAGTATASWS